MNGTKLARRLLGPLCCLLLTAQLSSAQGLGSVLSSGKTTATVAAAPGPDPLGRDTPRDAIYNFLEACHDGKFVRAAEYLDLSKISRPRRQEQGPELAQRLGVLLDRDSQFELEHLDNTAAGKQEDDLAADIDRLASFQVNGEPIPLYLQQETQNGRGVWLVSNESVLRIVQLSALMEGPPIEKKLPAALVNTKFFGTAAWVWIALILLVLLLSVVSKLLSRMAIAIVKPVAKRYARGLQSYRLETFTEPVRLLVAVAVFRACMEVIAPSALVRDYLLSLLVLLVVFGAAAVLTRVVDVVSDQVISRLDPRQRALSYSVVPLGVRFLKICIFGIAVLITLDQWGFHMNTILAGVGVGGLAVALAAQKTIENLFGGISVISDRPVLVGDVCQFGGQTGTVEDIGLRSTRIRTPERTLVTIPNAQFSTMTLENLSRRDRMLFHPILHLRRDTPPGKIRDMMSGIEQILREHGKIDPTDVPVRFTKICPDSYTLEVFSYVLTEDSKEFLRIQSELLLKLLDLAERLQIGFAVPFAESLTLKGSEPRA
jgi:MscS family membrane protein